MALILVGVLVTVTIVYSTPIVSPDNDTFFLVYHTVYRYANSVPWNFTSAKLLRRFMELLWCLCVMSIFQVQFRRNLREALAPILSAPLLHD